MFAMRAVGRAQGVSGSGQMSSLLVRAWTAVALIPVFFFVSFVVGQGLYGLMGYLPEDPMPLWVDLVASLSALAVFLLPCGFAVWYGERANAAGQRAGLAPLAVGAIAGLGILVLTLVTLLSTPHL